MYCTNDTTILGYVSHGPESQHFRIIDVEFMAPNGGTHHAMGNVYPQGARGRLDLKIIQRNDSSKPPIFEVHTAIYESQSTVKLRGESLTPKRIIDDTTVTLQVPFPTDLDPAIYRLEVTLSEINLGDDLRYEQELIVQRRGESP